MNAIFRVFLEASTTLAIIAVGFWYIGGKYSFYILAFAVLYLVVIHRWVLAPSGTAQDVGKKDSEAWSRTPSVVVFACLGVVGVVSWFQDPGEPWYLFYAACGFGLAGHIAFFMKDDKPVRKRLRRTQK